METMAYLSEAMTNAPAQIADEGVLQRTVPYDI